MVRSISDYKMEMAYDPITNPQMLENGRIYRPPLVSVPRVPFQCPIGNCLEKVCGSEFLSHFLIRHTDSRKFEFNEAFDNTSILINFEPKRLKYFENQCLDVFLYGGKNSNPQFRPAHRHLCAYSSVLPLKYASYDAHLPIMVVVHKTCWSHLFSSHLGASSHEHKNHEEENVYYIWLVSPNVTSDIWCSLTAFDSQHRESLSKLVLVRGLSQAQNLKRFIELDNNFLRLTQGTVNRLLHTGTTQESIQIEVMIKNYENQKVSNEEKNKE